MIIKLSARRLSLLMIAYIFGAETLILYMMPPGEPNPSEVRQELNRLQIPEPIRKKLA